MGPLWIAIAASLAAAALGWLLRRRSLARQAACRHRFAALLAQRRPGLSVVEAAPGRWRLDGADGPLATVDGRALTRAAAGRGDGDRERLLLSVADAARHGPRPFAGDFDLKRQGPRTLPRLADEGLGLLDLGAPAVRHAAVEAAGLTTVYVVDGAPRPAYLTDEHLAGAGIDARDVHGVAIAVLRQRFEEEPVRAALAGGEAALIETADGCGGSRLLLLPEALRRDEAVFAAAPTPGRLLVADERTALDRAVREIGETTHPLPPAVFRATRAGLRRES